MGLIQAFSGALSNTLANQWLEFFYCDNLPNNVLMRKGQHKVGAKSSNTKGEENVISNGSKIIVNDGQCMIIVDNGKVVEMCSEPGGYTFDTSASPSIFAGGGLGQNIVATFKEGVEQFKYGGQAGRDQRIYYFNLKELLDNKFGTQNPIPFRVTYPELGRSFTAGIRCNGVYTFKVADPMKFYANVAGNVSGDYTTDQIASQMKSEFLDAMQPAFAEISNMGIRYDQIALHNRELKEALRTALAQDWLEKRGLMLENVSINSTTMSKEDEARIQKFEDLAWNRDPMNAGAVMVDAQAKAMETAAGNAGGAMMGFMNMNAAMNAGGMSANNLFAMGQQQQMLNQQQAMMNQQMQQPQMQQQAAPAAGGWTCSCGAQNTGKFCLECGKPKPAPASAEGWTCKCGAVNKGKFCAECGSPKPAGAPLYRCDKCGWVPADPHNPPKFCPECGDPFDENDAQ